MIPWQCTSSQSLIILLHIMWVSHHPLFPETYGFVLLRGPLLPSPFPSLSLLIIMYPLGKNWWDLISLVSFVSTTPISYALFSIWSLSASLCIHYFKFDIAISKYSSLLSSTAFMALPFSFLGWHIQFILPSNCNFAFSLTLSLIYYIW